MPRPVSLLTIEFLGWVASRPRTHAEAREAWRSTCPTTCAWEDAISAGLIQFENGGGLAESRVILTPQGRAALAER
jgi:hypothetical protein